MAERIVDFVVIGTGATGGSTAMHLAERGYSVIGLEKEAEPAMGPSGNNSGVIHVGYNIDPKNEFKARHCAEGNRRIREYCMEKGVDHFIGGILVVAAMEDEAEEAEIYRLLGNAEANGVRAVLVASDDIPSIEPSARGEVALHAIDGGSIDSRAYVKQLVEDAKLFGAEFMFNTKVVGVEEGPKEVIIKLEDGREIVAGAYVNAAGLYADIIADEHNYRIVPFRGFYLLLRRERAGKGGLDIQSHIYGVSRDTDFSFLGAHFTRRVGGEVIAGPGAMLSLGREGVRGVLDRTGGGLRETLTFWGTYRMLMNPKIIKLAAKELRKSVSPNATVKELRRIVPDLRKGDLLKTHEFNGNRAQLVDRKGNLLNDAKIVESERGVHALGINSPGLTNSLPNGENLADKVERKLAA